MLVAQKFMQLNRNSQLSTIVAQRRHELSGGWPCAIATAPSISAAQRSGPSNRTTLVMLG